MQCWRYIVAIVRQIFCAAEEQCRTQITETSTNTFLVNDKKQYTLYLFDLLKGLDYNIDSLFYERGVSICAVGILQCIQSII